MKILFTNFFDPNDLGSRCLAAYLSKFGYEVRIIVLKDFVRPKVYDNPSQEDIDSCTIVKEGKIRFAFNDQDVITDMEYGLYMDELREWQPDIVGIGTRSHNLKYFEKIVPMIREVNPDIFILAGGVGPTLNPEIPLNYGADAVIRGEGEYALLDFVRAYEKKENWKEILNIAYLDGGNVIKNLLRPQERDLDNFPLPFIAPQRIRIIDHNKIYSFDKEEKKLPVWQNDTYFILGTRGCPANCSFCGGRNIRKEYLKDNVKCSITRKRKLSSLKSELLYAVENQRPKFINFHDEFFIYPTDEMTEFFLWYAKNIPIPFYGHLSAVQLMEHPELLEAVYKAKYKNFGFAIQSGSEKFCREMYNRINHNKETLQAVYEFYERGLSGFIYFIMGNPLESEENLKKSYEFALAMPKQDVSYKRTVSFITNKLFVPFGDSLLKQKHPELLNMKFSNREFYYQAMLLEFCLLLDEKDFWELYCDPKCKEQPLLLSELYNNIRKEQYQAYLSVEINKLKGQKVWFWGNGETYRKNKHLFSETYPQGIILDKEYDGKSEDLPVLTPDEAFRINSSYPIVIFCAKNVINNIYLSIKRDYNIQADIVACC